MSDRETTARDRKIAPWRYGQIHRALRGVPIAVEEGPVYAGLGLIREGHGWFLIHLNTGHSAARLVGSLAAVLPVATQIAECCEWDAFLTINGWKQVCPDLPARMKEIEERFGNVQPAWATSRGSDCNDDTAREIAYARA